MSSGPPPRQPLAGGDRDGKDSDKQGERKQAPQGPSGSNPPVEVTKMHGRQEDDDDQGQRGTAATPSKPKFICYFCKQACANKAGLISHVRQSHDESFLYYECQVKDCKAGARLKTPKEVKLHFSTCHPEMSAEESAKPDKLKKHHHYHLDQSQSGSGSQDSKPVKDEKPGTSKQGAPPTKSVTDRTVANMMRAVTRAIRTQVYDVVKERDSQATQLALKNQEVRRQRLEQARAKTDMEGLKLQLQEAKSSNQELLRSNQLLDRNVKDLKTKLGNTQTKLDAEVAALSNANSENRRLLELNRLQKFTLKEAEVEKVLLKDELEDVRGENEMLLDYFSLSKEEQDAGEKKRKISTDIETRLAKREKSEPSDKQ